MNFDLFIWISFWIVVMGIPNFLHAKIKITYRKHYWQHTLYYLFFQLFLIFYYKELFKSIFAGYIVDLSLILIALFSIFLKFPNYQSKRYKIVKFFEIIFQQLLILAGVQSLKINWQDFSFLFLVLHLPLVYFVPRVYAIITIIFSIMGGIVFFVGHSYGIIGVIIALILHLMFWTGLHISLRSTNIALIMNQR